MKLILFIIIILYNLFLQNEALVTNLRQNLSQTQEGAIKADAMNQQIRNENEILRNTNRRLQMETDTARKDYNLQLQMLSNLQSIQVLSSLGFVRVIVIIYSSNSFEHSYV